MTQENTGDYLLRVLSCCYELRINIWGGDSPHKAKRFKTQMNIITVIAG